MNKLLFIIVSLLLVYGGDGLSDGLFALVNSSTGSSQGESLVGAFGAPAAIGAESTSQQGLSRQTGAFSANGADAAKRPTPPLTKQQIFPEGKQIFAPVKVFPTPNVPIVPVPVPKPVMPRPAPVPVPKPVMPRPAPVPVPMPVMPRPVPVPVPKPVMPRPAPVPVPMPVMPRPVPVPVPKPVMPRPAPVPVPKPVMPRPAPLPIHKPSGKSGSTAIATAQAIAQVVRPVNSKKQTKPFYGH
eukprot:TRINITY_DN3626_c0_g1_i8.p1 TRINITY_DN3626_c0_g1~~TRINITY_DN3626_c0_g1_i8.p1  ORF type:complete len:242 (+),score=62.14 TRINITY_DN3626_c0_g1_i8:105-830(+)